MFDSDYPGVLWRTIIFSLALSACWCTPMYAVGRVSCEPAHGEGVAGQSIVMRATGGVQPYAWSAPRSSYLATTGGVASVQFAQSGAYVVAVQDASESFATCELLVRAALPVGGVLSEAPAVPVEEHRVADVQPQKSAFVAAMRDVVYYGSPAVDCLGLIVIGSLLFVGYASTQRMRGRAKLRNIDVVRRRTPTDT